MFVIAQKDIAKYLSLSSVVGKKVIAKNGEVIGRVKEVAFDLGKILGIIVGAKSGKVLIGTDYIDDLIADSVVLKISPVTALLGRKVFDKDGRKLGKVTELVRHNAHNDLTQIVVSRGLFRKPLKVDRDDIQVAGMNIILKKVVSDA
jgi:sporulation protein YlmC with PRC-barrel domain